MTSKQPLNQDDIELFRKTIGDVRPVVHNTAELPRPARKNVRVADTHTRQTGAVYADSLFEYKNNNITAADEIQFRRPGVQDRVYRKLRRGQFRIAAELDLHGVTTSKARHMLDNFIAETARIDNQSCIRIIHGKGYGSKDGLPVLKINVNNWLQGNEKVLAYCSCRPVDGGTGAVYVILKMQE